MQQRATLGEDFNQLSGEDATVLGYMAHGGHGCISVTSNVAPRLCSEFHVAWQHGDLKTALKLHDKLMPVHTNLFIESNPSPVKYALSLLGKIDEKLRLPMVPVSEPTRVAACSAIGSSMVGDIIMPIVGAVTGGLDFSNYFTGLSKAVTAGNLADAKKQGAVLAWGNFLTLTLNFIIIAFVLFMVVRVINQLKRRDEAAPPPKPTRQEELLTEIRDLLKSLDVRGLKPSDTAAGLK